MLICETDVERALDVFLTKARIPRGGIGERGVSRAIEKFWMRGRLVSAFLKALEAIESIDYCYGFDASKIDVVGYRQDKHG